ncbi:MAG TPA: LysR family transcriptional regulator [Stellaceae bacterium]|nr:LysR family transcriptional regulator [Stellaceae bacterium]
MAIFVKVVESSSFAAAARHFRLSPAMVSRHVHALEEQLGAQLLNRTTRRVSPTEVGQAYYQRVRQVLADIEEADRLASDLQAAPSGLLRITSSQSFGIRHLAPAIADYLALCPGVQLDVTLNDRYLEIIEEGFDLAIRIGHLGDSSLIARRLAPIRMALCAAPDYLARHGAVRAPADLAQHDCLVYTYAASQSEWRFIDGAGREQAVHIAGRLVANNGDVLRTAALQGHGIALGPTFILGEDIRAGTLVRLLPDYTPPEVGLYAVYPPSRHLSAKVRSFVDFLVTRFGGEPEWDRAEGNGAGRSKATA